MAEEEWMVEYQDRNGREATSPTVTSKAAAFRHARDLIRGLHTVHRIVGPNEVIVDKAAIEQWVKANPE